MPRDGAILSVPTGKLRKRHGRLVSFVVAAIAAISILPTTARAQMVDVAILLAADVSLSVDDKEFQLQQRGYAAAVTNPPFVQAIQAGAHKAVALLRGVGRNRSAGRGRPVDDDPRRRGSC